MQGIDRRKNAPALCVFLEERCCWRSNDENALTSNFDLVIPDLESPVSELAVPRHHHGFDSSLPQFLSSMGECSSHIGSTFHARAHGAQRQQQRLRIGIASLVSHVDIRSLNAVKAG